MVNLRNGNVYIPSIHSGSSGLRVYSTLEKAENDMLGCIRQEFSKHQNMAYSGLHIENLQVDTGAKNHNKYTVNTRLNRKGNLLIIEVKRESLFESDRKTFTDKISISI